jgi:hypothetical protein
MINYLVEAPRNSENLQDGDFVEEAIIRTINKVILDINKTVGAKESIVKRVTETPGVAALTVAGVLCNCNAVSGNCDSCLVKPCSYSCVSSFTMDKTADAGKYLLTILPGVGPYYDSYVNVGPFEAIGIGASVTKISQFVFEIKVYPLIGPGAGVPVADLLNNTIIEAVLCANT